MLGEKPLTQAWCCYEIALFNQRCATAKLGELALQSFIAPTTSIYRGWARTETTEADDKTFIEDRIYSVSHLALRDSTTS